MATSIEKKIEQTSPLPARERIRLRKQAEMRGVPMFALRLLSARRLARMETETTLRYRHD